MLPRPPRTRGELANSRHLDRGQKDGRARFFDGFANLGFFLREQLPPLDPMYQTFFGVLDAMRRLAAKSGATFVLVYFPLRIQAQPQDWQAVCKRWNLRPEDFDLMQPNTAIGSFCRRSGIAYCDLTRRFRQAATKRNLCLPEDKHINSHGHVEAALGVAEYIKDLGGLN